MEIKHWITDLNITEAIYSEDLYLNTPIVPLKATWQKICFGLKWLTPK